MIFWRYLRRRGLDLVCKTFLGCSVIFITLQFASTFPRIAEKDRQAAMRTLLNDKKVLIDDRQQHQQPRMHEGSVQRPKDGNGRKYQEWSPGKRDNMFYENIIVHFDLKGAPPRVPYFLELLDTVARSGATGVLIEWEDMFPWMGNLSIAKNTDAYSHDDVLTILSRARNLKLDVIPLVQTFGHLEWILKLEEFRRYRENDAYPQVLCLGDEEAVAIVKDALKQVIDVHKLFGLKFFHIGADEAFEFGVCQKSMEWIAKHGVAAGKQHLALSHMKDIALYVKQLTGGATVLSWHDMLKSFDTRIIAELNLGNIIEPVIWDYSENIVTMPDMSFSSLADNFPIVWASSAFKGANFPSAKYIDIRHYETNNRAWIDTKIAQERKFDKFHGIIIAGWQRYDHMAEICEILPIGTPSMVLNVQIALMGAKKVGFPRELIKIKCSSEVSSFFPQKSARLE
ncbi:glycosyl hydrolase family 20, catalytic domain protein [Dictyocaulus viviparus]|uniref:beta-N-acetylhexosaminidase n=1 Tax=Dictyocaulus viviparus TaxID=29172 RepID=A0A0D8YCK4_DICVI|nr:glycosyl hydrolase family 20, catalytic domain protein [Dictyocaulus viviparus]